MYKQKYLDYKQKYLLEKQRKIISILRSAKNKQSGGAGMLW
jgi:hypothetical protein